MLYNKQSAWIFHVLLNFCCCLFVCLLLPINIDKNLLAIHILVGNWSLWHVVVELKSFESVYYIKVNFALCLFINKLKYHVNDIYKYIYESWNSFVNYTKFHVIDTFFHQLHVTHDDKFPFSCLYFFVVCYFVFAWESDIKQQINDPFNA